MPFPALNIAVRAIVSLIFSMALSGSAVAQSTKEPRSLVELGVGQVGWLAPGDWSPVVSAQTRLGMMAGAALVVGVRGMWRLDANESGALFRRASLVSPVLILEKPLYRASQASIIASGGLTGSLYRFKYYSANPSQVVADQGVTWASLLIGIRSTYAFRPRTLLSLHLELRPRFEQPLSINPTLSFGLGF